MATLQDLITLGSVTLYDVDIDPSSGAGFAASVADIAITNAGTIYIKTGSGDTNWEQLRTNVSGTLQASYNSSPTPEITLDSTRGALSLRDNATPIGANLFEVLNNGLTQPYFAVAAAQVTILRGTATRNSSNATNAIYYVESDITAQNTVSFATINRMQVNPATAGSTTLAIGQMGSAIYSPTAAANLTAPVGVIGSLGMAEITGTAAASTIANAVATNSIMRNTSTNHTVTNAFLYRATMDSTVTNRTNGITNLYGFFMPDQSAITGVPGATNRWGIYLADNSQNFIQGQLGIGIAPASGQKLHVNGAVRIDSVGVKPSQVGQINIVIGGSVNYRGGYSGGASRILAEPATWLKVNINGTNYNLPAYTDT